MSLPYSQGSLLAPIIARPYVWAPTVRARVAKPVADWFTRYYGRALKTSVAVPLGRFGRGALPYQAYTQLDDVDPEADYDLLQPEPQRLRPFRVPIYTVPALRIPSATIDVPGHLSFEWENVEDTPTSLPQMSLEPIRRHTALREGLRSYKMPPPPTVLVYRSPSAREPNRRRHDQKVPGIYNRVLSLINRTYGPVSEFLEVLHAVQQNPNDFEAIATALAVNAAYDYKVGRTNRFLKETVYQSGYWPFPVGYAPLSRLWR